MPGGIQGRVLKSGRARTVYVDGRGTLVKRFHNPGAVQALRDRSRADAEHAVLSALFAREVPVPRPLEVRRARRRAPDGLPAGWEVVMERIPRSTTLAKVLSGDHRSPVPLGALAARLGELLARVHAAGLDHPDLHPGNVLVDASGGVWLIDFHQARMRERLGEAVLRRDVVSLAAAVRETMPPEARARFVLAWRAHLPAALAAALGSDAARGELAELAASIEDEARTHRRAVLAHAQGRWTRASGACEAHATDAGEVYARRGLPAGAWRELDGARAAVCAFELPDGSRLEALVLRRLPKRERRDRWYAAARLADHGIPCLPPLVSTPRWAAFEVPGGARRLARAPEPAALGALLGTLHDRGLDVDAITPADLWARPNGALLLAPPPRLLHLDARPGACTPERRFAALAAFPGRAESPTLRRAYAAAFRATRDEAERLHAELCDQ